MIQLNSQFARILFSLFCFFTGLLAFSKAFAENKIEYYQGTVVRVVDGDTIKFQPEPKEKKPWSIRMIGMDAPELHFQDSNGKTVNQGEWGETASAKLKELLPEGTPITLETHGKDKYKRVLGRIWINEKDINLEMVKIGWAIPYVICSGPTCNEDFFKTEPLAKYGEACRKMRAEQLGIFDKEKPLDEMPFEFRMRNRKESPTRVVGDFETKVLHQPTAYKDVDLCQRIFFDNKEEALQNGYKFEKL